MKRFHVALDEDVPKASVMRERCSGSWDSPRWLNADWLIPMRGARSAMKTGSAGFVRSRAEVGD